MSSWQEPSTRLAGKAVRGLRSPACRRRGRRGTDSCRAGSAMRPRFAGVASLRDGSA